MGPMSSTERPLLGTAEARHRLKEAMSLQEIEGNPFDAEDMALFAMLEREEWSEARCLEFVLDEARARAAAARNAVE
jgi:hypothetical protein